MRRPFRHFRAGSVLRIVITGGLVPLIASGCSDREPAPADAVQSSRVVQPPADGVTSPPRALVQIGETAEDLFDAARRSNWADAVVAIGTMKESATDLPVPTTFSNPDLAARLQNRLEEVGESVSTQQRLQTMDSANQITRLVAELSADDQTQFPYALVMLGYYGRDLALGIAADDRRRLQRAAADLRQTWDRFEPSILQLGAADEARRFTDIVVQLEVARAPGDFVEPTRAELDAVDRLEKIFRPS